MWNEPSAAVGKFPRSAATALEVNERAGDRRLPVPVQDAAGDRARRRQHEEDFLLLTLKLHFDRRRRVAERVFVRGHECRLVDRDFRDVQDAVGIGIDAAVLRRHVLRVRIEDSVVMMTGACTSRLHSVTPGAQPRWAMTLP